MTARGMAQNRRNPPPQHDGWKQYAACGTDDVDARLFDQPELAPYALQVCADCPDIHQCGESRPRGMDVVWGGHAYYPKRSHR